MDEGFVRAVKAEAVMLETTGPCAVMLEKFIPIKAVADPSSVAVNVLELRLITAVGLETGWPVHPVELPVVTARADAPLDPPVPLAATVS